MGNPILKIHTNGLLPLLLASLALPVSAQVSSENYVQTTQRISDTRVLATTQYYDGLGRPFEKVEQRVTPSGDNLIHLQQYDGLGREWRSWNPIYSSSAFLNPSDVSSLSQSQYSDSHAFSQNNYESSPLNRVIEVEGIGEDWKGHSVKSAHLVNSSSFPLNCKYYRVSMSGELQNKGYYPEGRLYVTKTTDEDGHESYEFKNLAGHVILQRVMLGGTESADTYYLYDYRGNLSFNIMGKDEVFYDYNVRNWPLSIESDNFKERLCYNVCNNGLCSWRNLYNGNIGAISWQCGNGIKRAFHFTYNAQNMLTDSGYNEGDRLNDWQGNYDESLSYDKMGNVQSLLRSGLLDDGSYGLIDNLSYSYHGNQLLKVDDAANGPYYQGAFHFVDGADEAVEYEYDANGNMVRDLNKCISSISYDLNNQPRKIEYNDGRNASYVYDAEGNKLSVSYNLTAMSSAQPQMPVMQSSDVASANVSNGQKTIEYCGNIIYDGDETMILNDVGYALYDKDNTLTFHYYLKDHLGNNRVVVSEDGKIEQENDYYPTGALMASSKGGDTQCFKFNGKELDRTNGLNWYDYGARNYDAAIVRWDGMDKLCEKYYPFTPYGYCKNNFVNAIDLDGNRIVVWYKDDKGKDKSFVFTGKKIKIPDNQFVRDFVQAYNYNVGNGGGKAMQFAAKADYDYHIEDATNQEEVVTIYHNGGRNDKVIFWESRKGLLLSNGGRQSAATRLEHEFDHYVDDVKNHKAHSDRQNVYKTSYKNMEEYRVISGNEAFTAKRNGEGVRHNHYGKTYKTKSSTSIY